MKLNELKCDLCEKNRKVSGGDELSTDHNLNSSSSTVGDHSIGGGDASNASNKLQTVMAKCLDCNFFMCSTCFSDHQAIASFGNHQVVNLNNISINKEDKESNEDSINSSEQQRKLISLLNSQQYQQKQLNNNHVNISNIAQMQQQYNNLEDQFRVKNKQHLSQLQPLQSANIQNIQQQQQQRLFQIETEIQKSYNFYTQMLKERKDYLINELSTIVQYAVLNHSQNLNKQLKLKSELEQKRVNLELSDSMQAFLSSDPSKISPFSNDMNNNKVTSQFAELNNLTMINNQIIGQLKANNPLSQIEFVSNYSAIQTSIRNTFGYIRINNQMNLANHSNSNQQVNNKQPDMNNFVSNEQVPRNLNNSAYLAQINNDYLAQINKNTQNRKSQNELHIDLDNFGKNNFNTEAHTDNNFDNFIGNNNVNINTFSASSQSSLKSNSSVITNSSSGSFNNTNTTNNQHKASQQHQYNPQKPIGTSHSCYDTTSPISITTDNLQATGPSSSSSCFPSNSSNASTTSNNYFVDHWSNSATSSNNELITKSKTSGHLDDILTDDFFNSTMVKTKNSWSTIMSDTTDSAVNVVKSDRDGFGMDMPTTKDSISMTNNSSHQLFLPYFEPTSNENNSHHQSPTLTTLLNNSHKSSTGMLNNNISNKFSIHHQAALTLSAGSNKSTGSSSHLNQHHHQKQIMSATSSTSASPEERLSSSASSACSDTNINNNYHHDSSLTALKIIGNGAAGTSLMNSLAQLSNGGAPVGSSARCSLRRSKMIYHCKFGEFGINDGQFTEPSGVTINTNNDIIVADTNSHRIQIFDKDGRFKFKFGECGKRDGQLLYPNRVSVVKHTGDIVVTERSPTHQIQIYNKYGQFLRKFGANILQHPRGVCVDNKGRIIVVECKVMRVLIFDLMGNVLQKFNCSKYLEFPNGVCCSSGLDREEIYISDNRAHCIKVFDYNGNFIRQIGGEGITNYPIGVGINTNNEILVADNHNNFNLTVFSQDGTLINALESKVKHAQCFDVGLMDDGSIVLASKDYRIYVYKYVNNNLALSGSYTNENNQLIANEQNGTNDINFEQRDIMQNDEQLYDLFSPQMAELTNYNQLMNSGGAGSSQFGSLNKSSENLLDNLNVNTFNCLMTAS